MTSPGPEEESPGQSASGAAASSPSVGARGRVSELAGRDVATSRGDSTLGDLGEERTPVRPGWGTHHRPKTDSITGARAPVSCEPNPSAPDSCLPGAPSPA